MVGHDARLCVPQLGRVAPQQRQPRGTVSLPLRVLRQRLVELLLHPRSVQRREQLRSATTRARD